MSQSEPCGDSCLFLRLICILCIYQIWQFVSFGTKTWPFKVGFFLYWSCLYPTSLPWFLTWCTALFSLLCLNFSAVLPPAIMKQPVLTILVYMQHKITWIMESCDTTYIEDQFSFLKFRQGVACIIAKEKGKKRDNLPSFFSKWGGNSPHWKLEKNIISFSLQPRPTILV